MAFVRYEPKRSLPSAQATVHLTAKGNLTFNKVAVHQFLREDLPAAILYWDANTRQIAFEPAPLHTRSAVHGRPTARSVESPSGRTYHLTGFLARFGVTLRETALLEIRRDGDHLILGPLPASPLSETYQNVLAITRGAAALPV